MTTFFYQVSLAAPLFMLVFIGFMLMRCSGWSGVVAESLNKFVFYFSLPAMLFHLMCDRGKLPEVDARLLIAFFGGCMIVFIAGRLFSWKFFGLNGIEQSLFAIGGVFSNNVMLGLPLAKIVLGDDAIPSVALVLVFNSLVLWTLITISVEWTRNGSFSISGFGKTLKNVLKTPTIIGILAGALVGSTGVPLPQVIDQPLSMLAQTAAPLALVSLGMGLVEYGVKEGWKISLGICWFKLVLQPFFVWAIALALGLPAMETKVVVLLASMAVGANVYMMSHQFNALKGPIASAMVLSTLLASLTTPLALTLIGI